MKSTMTKLFLAALLVLVPLTAQADHHDSKRWNTNDHGVVLDGYDVVAYHTHDQAVRGSAKHKAEYEGGTFYFSSAENRAAFTENPAKYAPQFGGFCAFGLAKNKMKVPVDPETYKIYNGELLVFFNDMYEGQKVNTKLFWNQGERELYQEAAKTWPTLD